MDQTLFLIYQIAVLIFSVVVHEVSHGLVANKLGDPTAKELGRLSLNPFKHLDPVGSVLVPLMTSLLGGFIFGWAKPVPYNPYNLKNQRYGPATVAAAGPASNFVVATVFGLALRFLPNLSPLSVSAVAAIVFINILLGIFNLLPIPPLDGSKVAAAVLPYKYERLLAMLEQYGLFLVLIFIFFLFPIVFPIIPYLFRLITGLPFVF